jgi:hypothetical protein
MCYKPDGIFIPSVTFFAGTAMDTLSIMPRHFKRLGIPRPASDLHPVRNVFRRYRNGHAFDHAATLQTFGTGLITRPASFSIPRPARDRYIPRPAPDTPSRFVTRKAVTGYGLFHCFQVRHSSSGICASVGFVLIDP